MRDESGSTDDGNASPAQGQAHRRHRGGWYTAITGGPRDEFTNLARRIADELPSGASALEVAPGPGYLCIELAKFGSFAVTGLDLSRSLTEIARKKADEAGVKVDFRQGNAASMPFPDDMVDFLVCRAAFKNFAEPVKALQEMYRVLKPGGRGLIIDLRRDASPGRIDQTVEAMKLGLINRTLTKLTFRFLLCRTAYSREQFQRMLAETRFRSVDIQEVDIGFEILMTK